MEGRFLDIEMPDQFVLEVLTPTGGWFDYGMYRAEDFLRAEDGTYRAGGTWSSPLYLRCLRQDGNVVYVIDGGGDPYTYRLVPLPDERYQRSK